MNLLPTLCVVLLQPGLAEAVPDYVNEVRPLLVRRCVACHGPEKQRGGLRLDIGLKIRAGGASGPVVRSGKSGESLLIQAVCGVEGVAVMPPKGPRLSAEEIVLLRRWIDAGAVVPANETVVGGPESKHWGFQPIGRPAAPAVKDTAWVRNPIDAFVLARLEKEGIRPAPEADRVTLIRRLSLDLLGLPPTPGEVDNFLRDERRRRLRAARRPPAGLAALWRTLGSALARPCALCRLQRLQHRHAAADLEVPRLGSRRRQPRPAFRSVRHRAAGRRPAAGRDARSAHRHRFPSQHADQRGRRHRPGAVPRRVGRRPRQHDGLGLPRPDSRLLPVPRPQVRSAVAARILPVLRLLQQRGRADAGTGDAGTDPANERRSGNGSPSSRNSSGRWTPTRREAGEVGRRTDARRARRMLPANDPHHPGHCRQRPQSATGTGAV